MCEVHTTMMVKGCLSSHSNFYIQKISKKNDSWKQSDTHNLVKYLKAFSDIRAEKMKGINYYYLSVFTYLLHGLRNCLTHQNLFVFYLFWFFHWKTLSLLICEKSKSLKFGTWKFWENIKWVAHIPQSCE